MKAINKLFLVRNLQGITSNQKNILLILISHIGNNECCFLSIDTIVEESCIVKRTAVIENLRQLSELKLIIIIPPSNGFKSNRYSINLEIIKSHVSQQEKEIKKNKRKKMDQKNAIQNEYRRNKRLENNQKRGVTYGHLRSNLRSLEESPRVTGGVTQGHPNINIKYSEDKNKIGASRVLSLFEQLKIQNKKPKITNAEALKKMEEKLKAEGTI